MPLTSIERNHKLVGTNYNALKALHMLQNNALAEPAQKGNMAILRNFFSGKVTTLG
jgi:hypothetical protein